MQASVSEKTQCTWKGDTVLLWEIFCTITNLLWSYERSENIDGWQLQLGYSVGVYRNQAGVAPVHSGGAVGAQQTKKLQMDSHFTRKSPFWLTVTPPRVWLKQTYPPHQLPRSLHQHLTIQPTNSQLCYKTMTCFQRRLDKRSNDVHSNGGMMCFVVEIMQRQWLGCSRHLTCNSVPGKSHALEHPPRGQSRL